MGQDTVEVHHIVGVDVTYQLPCRFGLSGFMRWDLVNELLDSTVRKRFLEIGVADGITACRLRALRRVGVDPEPLQGAHVHYDSLFVGPSDAFFELVASDEMFDVVLIDGLHHADQVLRDVDHVLEHLAPGGVIVLHDCNPQSEIAQIVPRQVPAWNGDCWKAIVTLRATRADLDVFTIDSDEGLGVVRRRKPSTCDIALPEALTYAVLETDRVRLLGLVSIREGLLHLGFGVIELGGGDQPMFQPNVDVRGGPYVAFTANFDEPLPIKSDEWAGVFSSYALEHISWRKIRGFVSELYRILQPGGVAVLVTANAEAQMRWALARPEWNEAISQCLGGDQNYSDNTHKVFLSPAFVCRLFSAIGFSRVLVVPHGALGTDMIIEAQKPVGLETASWQDVTSQFVEG